MTRVRVHVADLLGTSRCKVIPPALLDEAAAGGLRLCVSVMCTNLAGLMPEGTGLREEVHYRDMEAIPDLSTLRILPWEPGTAACIADLYLDGEPLPCSPREVLRRAALAAADQGFGVRVGHELEFFLLERDGAGLRQYSRDPGRVYRMDCLADPRGVVRAIEAAVVSLGLPLTCVTQEYDGSQWELNMRHAEPLEAADGAHFFKLAIKEVAAQHGLIATCLGKPLNNLGTSGYHLHLSLNVAGQNAFVDPASPDGLSDTCRWFIGGLMEHAPGASALLGPTVNAYKRYAAEAFAPRSIAWGHDNRTVLVRVPHDRDAATRVEHRGGDGAASPYLASGTAIFAGLDGIHRRLQPHPPTQVDTYRAPPGTWPLLPGSLGAALDALQADAPLRAALGDELIHPFVVLKRDEVRRFEAAVTDWELREYLAAL